MDFLAVIGIVSVVLLVAGLILVLARLIVIRRGRRRLPETQRRPPLPLPTGPDPHEQERAAWQARFREAYGKLFERLELPKQAYMVVKCCSVFSLEHVPVEHYAWQGKDALYFFPKWTSLAAHLTDPAFLHIFTEGEEKRLFGWKIPTDDLESYTVDKENGVTAISYSDNKGKPCRTILLEGGDSFLRAALPLLDSAVLERQAYLGSTDNIRDMKSEMRTLEDQYARGELTAVKYEREKERIMRQY